MSDGIYIPGISNKSNSQATIDRIMGQKKLKLDDLDKDKSKINEKQKNLGEVAGKVVSLDRLAKALYGLSNPFDEKVAATSDDNVSAKVTKTADIGEYSIEVERKAQPHRVASVSLDRKTKIDAGSYKIGADGRSAVIRFAGGTVEDFQKSINEQGNGVVKSSITFDTAKTMVLILESMDTGEKNRLSFDDGKTKDLFKKLGFYEDVLGFNKEFSISNQNTKNNNGTKTLNISNERLHLNTGDSYTFKLDEPVVVKKSIFLEIDLSVIDNKLNDNKDMEKEPTGPNFSNIGDTNILGVEIPGEKNLFHIPPYILPEKQLSKDVSDKHFVELVTDRRKIELDELDVGSSPRALKFQLQDVLEQGERLTGVIFKNNDTSLSVSAGKIKVYDEESRDGVKFKNELSKAQDASFKLDGLDIKRSVNNIDDLLKGVTLTIYGKTDGVAKLQIDRDYPKMVKALTDFMTEYNQLIDMINVKTAIKSSSLDITDVDKDKGKGVLSTEQGLKNFSSKLRLIMMSSYPTKYGDEFSLLSQIGISTNETQRAGTGSVNADKLKGLLEFDEEKFADKFIEVMDKYPDGIKELFGNDHNKDFVYDTGIGVEINKLLKGYLQKSTGFFDMRNEAYNSEVKQKNAEIDKYKEKLKEEEQKLKETFYKMEKSSQELEDNRKKFDNMNKQQ